MKSNENDIYQDRLQTETKHRILRNYLYRLIVIVGHSWAKKINYIDCFSGPWKEKSENYEDTSFGIAINELKSAQQHLKGKGKNIELRCFFVEKKPSSFAKLQAYVETIEGVKIKTSPKALEGSIPEITKFISASGPNAFTFTFIDPTGFTGFGIEVIRPLLRTNPGEVLITLMSSYLHRFVDAPQSYLDKQYADLFGDSTIKQKLIQIPKEEREEYIVQRYSEIVMKEGQFKHFAYTPIIDTDKDAVIFNLVYATRNSRGIDEFKDVEKKVHLEISEKRIDVKQQKEGIEYTQLGLFEDEFREKPKFLDCLRLSSLKKAEEVILGLIKSKRRLCYIEIWNEAMKIPLIWESDVKDWIENWHEEGIILIHDLRPRARRPNKEENHIIELC